MYAQNMSLLTNDNHQGVPAPVAGAMTENATLFLAYGQLQHLCRWVSSYSSGSEPSKAQLSLSVAGAGAVTSFVLWVLLTGFIRALLNLTP